MWTAAPLRLSLPLTHTRPALPRLPPTAAAEGITGELQRNRETLGRIRGNVGIVSGSLDQARRILRSMSRRELRTKIAIGVFAVCMLAIIGGLIYWVSAKKNEPQQ
jgi:hypothetical protein